MKNKKSIKALFILFRDFYLNLINGKLIFFDQQ